MTTAKQGPRQSASKVVLAAIGCMAAMVLAAPAAQAAFSVTEFGTSLEQNGELSRQAGAHPDFTTDLDFSTEEPVRNVKVDLPAGMVGNPTVTDRCTAAELVALAGGFMPDCPPTSQVGTIKIVGGLFDPELAVYNMVAPPTLPALFAFNFAGAIIRIEPSLRSSDYGISSLVRDTSNANGLIRSSTLTLWGVPADDSHARLGFDILGQPILDPAPRRPFLTSPTSCPAGPVGFTAEADSWFNTGTFSKATSDADFDGAPYQWDGCEQLPFDPSLRVAPDSRRAGVPSGLDVKLTVPQGETPEALASAHVKKTVVTLPEGFAVSPSAATGQGACSPAQIGLGSNDPPTCPDSATIGTLEVDTPLLDEPMHGDVILAKQGDNPFGSLLAMYLVIRGPGIMIKLPGKIEADPQTGQLTTTFDNTPQLPFEALRVSFRGGPKAPLVTPSACGTYSAEVEMTSWASSIPVERSSSMTIDEGCGGGGFDPVLRAGTSNPRAGAFSPFTLRVLRNDSEQNVSRLEATLPEGLLAKLAGVPHCGEAQAASGSCPAGSQVGRVTVAAGAGETPVTVPQPGKAPTAVYLAGPYKGAPYSLVVKVPAQAGPFDLGTVTVRNALEVDPVTTQATTISDPLPQILQGIPIAYRDVQVAIDRPGFTLNPTSCDEMKVDTTLTSAGGKTATPSSRFQVLGCADLGFKPKLALKFSGPTHRSAHPKLKATLTMPKGGANIAKTTVLMPPTEFIDNAHISNPCTRVQFAADQCPPGSILGNATAYTPLLDQPLTGPVYFRSNGGERQLPDLVADLDGPIHVTLVGFIDSVKRKGTETGQVRTRFQNVPDAPVSKFVLNLKGGDKGLLVNNTELCKAKPRARAEFTGQNGKRSVSNPLVKVGCGKGTAKG